MNEWMNESYINTVGEMVTRFSESKRVSAHYVLFTG